MSKTQELLDKCGYSLKNEGEPIDKLVFALVEMARTTYYSHCRPSIRGLAVAYDINKIKQLGEEYVKGIKK